MAQEDSTSPQPHISSGKTQTVASRTTRGAASVTGPRSRLGLTTARPQSPGAAPTCSDGCPVVHGDGYSCAHGHHHRLVCIFWGENCPVTFSAPEEEPGWRRGLGSPVNSRLGRSLSERGAAQEAACYHHLGSLRSASYLPPMCRVPPTSPCSSEAARSVCGPCPPGQRRTVRSLTLQVCSVSGPQSCLHAAAPLELGDPTGTHPGDSRGIRGPCEQGTGRAPGRSAG